MKTTPTLYCKSKKYELFRITMIALLSLFLIQEVASAKPIGFHLAFLPKSKMTNNSQKVGSIQGTVLDAKGKPIPSAVVNLISAQDTALLEKAKPMATTSTDEKGVYSFQAPVGKYLISTSYIGFSPQKSDWVLVKENSLTKVNPLILTEKTLALKEVSITAKRPFIERKVDRTVLNIESDITATGENAIEVLKKAPGVTIDKDDHIHLQGKQGVTVMLDGKLTYLSLDALTNLLKNTPATSIEQIEIITQPSAKYDASGNSGIINIKTKKLKKPGLNGTLTAGYGRGHYNRTNESVNLNFKSGNWNVFGNYDYSLNNNQQRLLLTRYFGPAGGNSIFDQTTYISNLYNSNNYKIGVDYSLGKHQTIGAQINGYYFKGHSPTDNTTFIEDSLRRLDSTLKASSSNYSSGRGVTYDLNYKNTLDTLGQELIVSLDYSRYNYMNHTDLMNVFYKPDSQNPSSDNAIKTISPSIGDIRVGKADYTLPFSKTAKLDMGVKYSWVKTDNNVGYDSLINGSYRVANSQSNHFIYTEKVAALYGSFSKQWKKTSLVLGLRLENTASIGNSITLNNQVNRSYLDFFPNFSLSQKLDSNNQLGLSYSRRIDRPSYQDLNPFRFYLDQYTYQEGNPFLKPQYTHSFEISNTFKQSTFVSFNFSWTKDVTTQVLFQNDSTKVTKVMNENLNNLYSYNLTFSRPFNPTPWWTFNLNLNGNYNRYTSNATSFIGTLQKSKITGDLNINSTFTLPHNWTAEISGFYTSPFIYGYLEAQSQYSVDLGIQKSFLKKKGNVKLGVTDIIKTNNFFGNEIHDNVNLHIKNYQDNRRVNITVSYSFGTHPQRVSKSSASEQELNRVKH